MPYRLTIVILFCTVDASESLYYSSQAVYPTGTSRISLHHQQADHWILEGSRRKMRSKNPAIWGLLVVGCQISVNSHVGNPNPNVNNAFGLLEFLKNQPLKPTEDRQARYECSVCHVSWHSQFGVKLHTTVEWNSKAMAGFRGRISPLNNGGRLGDFSPLNNGEDGGC